MIEGVLLLGGPTAAGKSVAAVDLAERFGAEIVGADSRQIYTGMPIGTAIAPAALQARVPHHLIEFLDPSLRYSAAQFAIDALTTIDAISERRKRTIVAGGTGFYMRALCGDVALSGAFDPVIRMRLARESAIHPAPVLHAWLSARDPVRAAAIEPNDRYRVTRALEVALSPRAGDVRAPQPSLRSLQIPFVKVWLDVPPEVLQERIERRVDAMLAGGFLAEAERIGVTAVAADAVGYPQALAYLNGLLARDELRSALIRATRRYAKRQRTWFRGEPSALAIEATDLNGAVERIAIEARERLGWTQTQQP